MERFDIKKGFNNGDGKSEEYDVIVLGGGICGTSTSLFLTKLNKKVLIIERETVGASSQASSINSGILESFSNLDIKLNPYEILSSSSVKNGIVNLDDVLNAGTMSIYSYLNKSVEYHLCGLLQLCENNQQLKWAINKGYPQINIPINMKNESQVQLTSWLKTAASSLTSNSSNGVIVKASDLKLIEPYLSTQLKGAIYFPNCASAHPRKVKINKLIACKNFFN